MSSSEVKIVGANKLKAKLKWNGENRDAVKEVIKKNGNELNRTMKEYMRKAYIHTYPRDIPSLGIKAGYPYSTGDTAGSVNTVIAGGGLTAFVGPTTKYAPYVEYGTRFMEAEPTIRPAFERQVKIFKEDMDKLVE